MTFEAGPWHAFGTEMLERLVEHSDSDLRGMGDMEHSGMSLSTENNRQVFIKRPLYKFVSKTPQVDVHR